MNPANLLFKVVFNMGKKQLIILLTQAPSKGDNIRYNNLVFSVTNVTWNINNSFMPDDTGYQALIVIDLEEVSEVTL